jgi:hypothetical protein
MDLPPVINTHSLQRELNLLLASYDALDEERTLNLVGWCSAFILLLIATLAVMRARWFGALALPVILMPFMWLVGSVIRYWRGRPRTVQRLDARLLELAPQLSCADRLDLGWQHRRRLHERLFTCSPEVALGIAQILEVAGNRESLTYLRSLAGDGSMAAMLATRIPPEMRGAVRHSAMSLQRKLDRETDAETLLRGSENASEAELLRPAAPASDSSPAVLLRPDSPSRTPPQESSHV